MPRGSSKLSYEEANRGRNRTRTSRRSAPDIMFSGWVNFTIPVGEATKFEAQVQDNTLANTLQDLVAQQYRVTLSYETEDEVFVASAMCRIPDSVNVGMMTSQRSSDMFRAAYKLAYAIFELMPDDWSTLVGGGGMP